MKFSSLDARDLHLGVFISIIFTGVISACTTCRSMNAMPHDDQEIKKAPQEALKLAAIGEIFRTTMARYKIIETLPGDIAFCNALMRDIVSDQQVVAVEPDVFARTENAPLLGQWHQCDNIEPDEMESRDPQANFDGIFMLGEGPLRYYKINLDGNSQNGAEDLLYHEAGLSGATGYSWVNLKKCAVMGNFPVHKVNDAAVGLYQIDLVARRKNEYFILDLYPLIPGSIDSGHYFSVTRLKSAQPRQCSWVNE